MVTLGAEKLEVRRIVGGPLDMVDFNTRPAALHAQPTVAFTDRCFLRGS